MSPSESGGAQIVLGRERDGGAWIRGLCGDCNSLLGGNYDEEWARWWNAFADATLADGQPPRSRLCPVWLPAARPGAFIRSVLGGLAVLDLTFRTNFPEIAEAVRTGATMQAPDDVALLLNWTVGNHYYVTGSTARATLGVPGGNPIYAHAEVSWPPMDLILVPNESRKEWPSSPNILDFLQDDPEQTRETSLLLPVIDESRQFAANLSPLRQPVMPPKCQGGTTYPVARVRWRETNWERCRFTC
jgi:hypothetical protein